MKSYHLWKFKVQNCRAVIGNFMLIPMLALVIVGCGSPIGNNNTNEKNASRVSIPKSIQALALPVDTTSFTANLFLDEGTSAIASATITMDGTQKSVDFNDIAVAVGTHNFTIKFEVKTANYGLILASALSDTITITAGSSQILNFNRKNYNFDYDLDSDLVSNFDEIEAGSPPDDDVCVLGVSLVGYCSIGA